MYLRTSNVNIRIKSIVCIVRHLTLGGGGAAAPPPGGPPAGGGGGGIRLQVRDHNLMTFFMNDIYKIYHTFSFLAEQTQRHEPPTCVAAWSDQGAPLPGSRPLAPPQTGYCWTATEMALSSSPPSSPGAADCCHGYPAGPGYRGSQWLAVGRVSWRPPGCVW